MQTGANLNLSQATVIGGSFSGNGDVNITSTSATLQGLTGLPQFLGAVFNIDDNQTLNLKGDTFQIDGTIRLDGSDANRAVLETTNPNGPTVSLSGLGRIEFVGSGVLPCTADVGPNLTIASIEGGQGFISTALTNNGTVEADGGTLPLDTADQTNNNLLRRA